MEGFDELWPGGPRFRQRADSFRLSTDSVLLADFAIVKKDSRVLDLGSGAGVLCVLLAAKCESARITGLEIQPSAAELSRENLCENALEERVRIITADLREHRTLFKAESFDCVVSNPPYFAQNSGFSAPAAERAQAREEKDCTLSDVCAAARWALRWGGCFALVHRPERLAEVVSSMTNAGLEPKRMRFVQHNATRAPNLVLIEGRRGASPGLVIEPPLILTNASGGDSDEVLRIYKRGGEAPSKETCL